MRRLSVVLLCVQMLLSACDSSTRRATSEAPFAGLPVGHSLGDGDVQVGATLIMHKIQPGDRIRLSFPIFTNVSDQPLVVTGASFVSVPGDIEVLAYQRFTVNPDVGHLMTFKFHDPIVRGYGALPKRFTGQLRISPGATSPHYYVGNVRIKQVHGQRVSGCQVTYKTGGTEYAQTFGCTFGFTR